MTTNVSREQAFSVLATNFSISPSSSGYTLQVSADGVNYSDLFAVGANVTRMVTGVASGSYYKLRGNTDTNVIINWERQCNDGQGGGGGSEYILPAATQSTLGGVKVGAGLGVEPDGELWVNVDDILPAMDRLQRVLEFPSDANIGDAVAKIRQEDELITTEGELFNDGIDLTGKQASYIYVDDANGVEFTFNGGRWSISWENETFNLNLVDGEDNITGVYTIETKGDSESGWDINITDGVNLMWNMFIEKVYEIRDDNGFGSDYTVPAGREGTVNYTEVVTKDIPEGVYQLSNDGQCAEWSSPSTEWTNGAGWSLAFSYIPEGQVILAVEKQYSSANNGKHTIKYEEGVINVYNNNDEIEQTIEKDGVAHRVLYTTLPNSYYLWVLYKDNYIGFNLIGGLQIYSDIWDGTTEDQYWKKIGLPKPMAYFYNKPAAGIYNVDNEGKVTSLNYEPSHKAIYINSNENSSIYYLDALIKSGGSKLPSRIWAPTSSGTAGQVLTSSGDGAPEWSTMIKAQQITSAAYEALAVKDPNTLYLIVN